MVRRVYIYRARTNYDLSSYFILLREIGEKLPLMIGKAKTAWVGICAILHSRYDVPYIDDILWYIVAQIDITYYKNIFICRRQ